MECKNLWILTEERPKKEVLQIIFDYFAKDQDCGYFGQDIRIIPILNSHKCFDFTYEVVGFKCARVDHIYIKTVSGTSSFTDYLVFYQNDIPKEGSKPLYAIEETKTDDGESRNTGVYQRGSKFVYLRFFYPDTKIIMLYALQIPQKKVPTETYIFGTRLLLTLGVEVLGKNLDPKVFRPFDSIDELIDAKNSMRKAHKGNVPILITNNNDSIEVSGRLYKSGRLGHDPNIGALSLIASCLRKLGWKDKILITGHGLEQHHIGKRNKFIQIASRLDIKLNNIELPLATLPKSYWYYERKGEKLGTIFIHIVVENFTESFSVFENHAGCEKSYFVTAEGMHIPLAKYYNRDAYKKGDKKQRMFIPDLVLLDIENIEAITIEGKKYTHRQKAVNELDNYDAFDERYLKKFYPEYSIVRTVVLYGSTKEHVYEIKIGFLLNANGKIVLGINAPKLFRRGIDNLLGYWR